MPGFLRCLVGFLAVADVAAVGTPQALPAAHAVSGVRAAVSMAVESGCVTKVFTGELHYHWPSATVGLEALQGMSDAHPEPFVFHVEVAHDDATITRQNNDAFSKPENRRGGIRYLMADRVPDAPPELIAAYQDAVSHPAVTLRSMNFVNQSVTPPGDLARSRESLVATFGAAHLLEEIVKPNLASISFLARQPSDDPRRAPRALTTIPSVYEVPRQTPASQREAFALLATSQAAAPTMFVASSSIFPRLYRDLLALNEGNPLPFGAKGGPLTEQDYFNRFVQHYARKGNAVVEVPVGDGSRGIVLLPPGCDSAEILAKIPGGVLLARPAEPAEPKLTPLGPAPRHEET